RSSLFLRRGLGCEREAHAHADAPAQEYEIDGVESGVACRGERVTGRDAGERSCLEPVSQTRAIRCSAGAFGRGVDEGERVIGRGRERARRAVAGGERLEER